MQILRTHRLLIVLFIILLGYGAYTLFNLWREGEVVSTIDNTSALPTKSLEESLKESNVSPSTPTTASEEVATLDGRYDVTIVGGYETNPVDMGRPTILIGSALGITEEIFSDAFSGVTPEPQGHLNEEIAQANKAILLAALAPYGITNERLDEVTNYYRYPPGSTIIWEHTPAEIVAIVENRKVIRFEIINGGAGYTSIPTLEVPGLGTMAAEITVSYSENFSTNGAITSVTLK